MAQIINLRTWKKRAGRAADRALADGNSARFGRSKALKKLEQARADRERDSLDAHRIDRAGLTEGDDAPEDR
jgi:hypothetical protein